LVLVGFGCGNGEDLPDSGDIQEDIVQTDVVEPPADIDACSVISCQNPENGEADCVDGSCVITCDDFYELQGSNCVDRDECAVDNGGCGPVEEFHCRDRIGSDPRCSFNWTADWNTITEGITTLEYGTFFPSTMVVYGPTAFPVVFDQEQNHSTIAAARVEDGKVLYFGHEAHLFSGLSTDNEATRLILNTIGWMSDSSNPVIGVAPGLTLTAEFLAAQGFTVGQITTPELVGVDIYIREAWQEIAPEDVDRIQAFVRSGGGLITGGFAWWWGYTNPNTAETFAGNKMLRDMGIVVTAQNVGGGPQPVGPEPPTLYEHAGYAIEELLDHVNGAVVLKSDDLLSAVASIEHALVHLPLSFEHYYGDSFTAFLDAATPEIPTTAAPLRKQEDPIGYLAARIENKLNKELPADQVKAHPAAVDFPGDIPGGASNITETVTINASYAGRAEEYAFSNPWEPVWRSTGLYARPGTLFTVTVPQNASTEALSVLVGCHTDTLWNKEEIERFPDIIRTYPIESTSTAIASAFGGLIYVRIPAGTNLGPIEVTFDGVVRAPLYRHGETDLEEWRNTIRHYPGPWAELASDKFIITIPTSDVVDLDHPDQVMNLWDSVLDANADLEGNPHERVRPERFAFDRQISVGWMHSGYPLMAFTIAVDSLLDLESIQTVGSWGPFHEVGHNHQWLPWVLPGTTESTVNLFSIYVSETVFGIDRGIAHDAVSPTNRAQRMEEYLATGPDFSQWSVWTALETYLQLQEHFGWDFYTNLFIKYREMSPESAPTDDQQRIDVWVVESSEEAGVNLGPFYLSWGLPVSNWALEAISTLPDWTENPMLPGSN